MPEAQSTAAPDISPIADQDGHPEDLGNRIGLCLSGGGFRAMLFHVGALWRLNELSQLKSLDRISSVSGGSITAGLLGLKWNHLGFDATGRATRLGEEVIDPIRAFARETVDAWAIGIGALSPFSTISTEVERAYRKHLFGSATLQDLPDTPRFVINATNLQSGALFRFSKPYQGDYRIGLIDRPTTPLAAAVAASSAFPPVLSPNTLKVQPSSFAPNDPKAPADLTSDEFRSNLILSDGGVYDNLALETAWKSCCTILVSDAGQKIPSVADVATDWVRQSVRVLDVVDDQVRSLRKRILIAAYKQRQRYGTYWGIRTNVAKYGRGDALPCPYDRTLALAAVPTRLAAMDDVLQERLINWGYAVCDAAMRTHVLSGQPIPAPVFPYPRGV